MGLTRNQCVACGVDTARLSRLYTRRRQNFTCPNCGTRLAWVVPRWPYHVANLGLGLLGSLAAPVGIFMWIVGQGLLFLWLSAALMVVAIGIHIWLGRISVLQRAGESEPAYRRRFQNESFDSDPR